MIFFEFSKICLLSILITTIVESATTGSFVTSTRTSEESFREKRGVSSNPSMADIYDMSINTQVKDRYATTSISSRVRNLEHIANEAIFFVILPQKAFISEFSMEIDGKTYKAFVKEKEEAKNIYDEARRRGQSAAHVAVSARDSNKFTVSLNIEPQSKAVFHLKYEELLERKKGKYEIVINIHPGQLVHRLFTEVSINETAPLAFVRTPSLRSGNEIDKNNVNPHAEIVSEKEYAIVRFHPNEEEQKEFAKALFTNKEDEGLKGQFVVEYDVERNTDGGEVLRNDEYFVHYFAPDKLEAIPKQIVFVLDVSSSMMGEKMTQLIDAMVHILGDLKQTDTFSIVAFYTHVKVWDSESNSFSEYRYENNDANFLKMLKEKNIPQSILATPNNIAKAKAFVKTMVASDFTNILGGLDVGLLIVQKTRENSSEFRQPIIVFLTDGEPTEGVTDGDEILSAIRRQNTEDKKTPIFSLSFGSGADKALLKKLSSENLGFSKHIYIGKDTSLQLQDYYQLISSPLLKNVSFEYTKNATKSTKHQYPLYFKGSEIIVAGKVPSGYKDEYLVQGWKPGGNIQMKPKIIESPHSLERLWAYLKVRELLDERELGDKKRELTKEAVDLALKFSFVTPVTSLVVVKPNGSHAVDTEDASKAVTAFGGTKSNTISPAFGGTMSNRNLPAFGGTMSNRNLPDFGGTMSNKNLLLSGHSLSSRTDDFMFGSTSESLQMMTNSNQNFPTHSPLPGLENKSWFQSIKISPNIIELNNTDYYLLAGKNAKATFKLCMKTVSNKLGLCKLLHECPQAHPYLTDLATFKTYFCPLRRYAGICCNF
ncbi:hypothetical protein HHI36_003977 [Cryptolaemus montrouzieri]|uniref:Uncharacterized protein n=1 Tax=Cryptolaemus montrouzieri TaxID=559131 RepID=A0ABD2NQF0_9CUCU